MSAKHIYFIKPVGSVGPIKIGCSMFVDNRLKAIALWSPYPLEVIYQEEGGHDVERKLHKCFADLHSHHEWFHPGERLLKAISLLKEGMKISEAIDLSDERGIINHGGLGKGSKPETEIRKGFRSYKAKVRCAVDRAQRVTKTRRFTPEDIKAIIDKWDGFVDWGQPHNPIRPSAEEFRRLDEFVADPVLHCLTYRQWRAAA